MISMTSNSPSSSCSPRWGANSRTPSRTAAASMTARITPVPSQRPTLRTGDSCFFFFGFDLGALPSDVRTPLVRFAMVPPGPVGEEDI